MSRSTNYMSRAYERPTPKNLHLIRFSASARQAAQRRMRQASTAHEEFGKYKRLLDNAHGEIRRAQHNCSKKNFSSILRLMSRNHILHHRAIVERYVSPFRFYKLYCKLNNENSNYNISCLPIIKFNSRCRGHQNQHHAGQGHV